MALVRVDFKNYSQGFIGIQDGIAGSKNRATADIKEGLSGLAKNHTVEALGVIVELINNSMSDNVRLAAACSLLDRGYGKPSMAQVDNLIGHEITAFEVVADCQAKKALN